MEESTLTKRRRITTSLVAGTSIVLGLILVRNDLFLKRFAVVEPGRITRGAWQRPGPLRRLIRDEHLRTIVTLTAINRDDPKYISQKAAIEGTGVDWIVIPMRGSRATLEQMTEVADLLADPSRQPVFFHCVGGHHRSNLVQAAYRIRHQGWSADRAWSEVAALPWSRPDRDVEDHLRIQAYASHQAQYEDTRHEVVANSVGVADSLRRDRAAARLSRASLGNR